jgi:hypothetical protein
MALSILVTDRQDSWGVNTTATKPVFIRSARKKYLPWPRFSPVFPSSNRGGKASQPFFPAPQLLLTGHSRPMLGWPQGRWRPTGGTAGRRTDLPYVSFFRIPAEPRSAPKRYQCRHPGVQASPSRPLPSRDLPPDRQDRSGAGRRFLREGTLSEDCVDCVEPQWFLTRPSTKS